MVLSFGASLGELATVGSSFQSTATERNNARLIVQDGTDTLHAVYYDNGIIHCYSNDGAQSWSTPPTRITDLGRNPSLATGGSELIDLVYKRGGTLAYEIVHRSYNGTWSKETVLYNSPQIPVSRPVLAIDSAGDLHCVWQKSGYGATPNSEIWYSKRTNGNWGTALNVSTTYGASEYPTLAIGNDNNVHVFWKDSGDNIGDPKKVLYRKFTMGSGWDVDTTNVSNTLGNGSYSTMDPCAVVDSQNNIHLVWKDFQTGNKEIFYKKCTDGIWGENPLNLSATPNASDTPTITIDSQDNLTVAWAEKIDGIFYDVVVQKYEAAANLWSNITNISNTPGSDSRYPNLPAESGPGVVPIWTEGESSLYNILSWFDSTLSSAGNEGTSTSNLAILFTNHPNPFNPATNISFVLNQDAIVTLAVIDIRGHLIKTLISGPRIAGSNNTIWRGLDNNNAAVPSGVYFSILTVGETRHVQKMILIR